MPKLNTSITAFLVNLNCFPHNSQSACRFGTMFYFVNFYFFFGVVIVIGEPSQMCHESIIALHRKYGSIAKIVIGNLGIICIK